MKITSEDLQQIIKEEVETALLRTVISEIAEELSERKKRKKKGLAGACWSGYEAYGLKKKNGMLVPNCAPKKKKKKS